MSVYRTNFNLEWPVNNLIKAQNYLTADDMTEYLKSDIPNYVECKSCTADDIMNITWVLEDEQQGYIELKTIKELSQEDLDLISEWIRGQCSDGLGEGFEQQDFAEVTSDDEYDDFYDMASFDWRTNKYHLKLYKAN